MGTVARVVVAALLLLYGLAQALPGSRIADAAVGWVVGVSPGHPVAVALATFLWAVATGGFIGGGLGLLGAEPLRRAWARLTAAGASASLLLLLFFEPAYLIPGAVLDLAFLGGLACWSLIRGGSVPDCNKNIMTNRLSACLLTSLLVLSGCGGEPHARMADSLFPQMERRMR